MVKLNKLYFLVILIFSKFNFCAFYSQFGQDQYIYETFFKNKQNGFFIDIGAFDGITFSNSYFFEKNLNWKGICIEPANYLFNQLRKNRKSINLNCCVWKINGKAKFLEIKFLDGSNHGWSGLIDTYDTRMKQKLLEDLQNQKFTLTEKSVYCRKFNDICKRYNVKHIDLLSIDTEGSELDILRSIDFDEIYINIITVENNFNENHIKAFLSAKGFTFLCRLGVDDVFKNNVEKQ